MMNELLTETLLLYTKVLTSLFPKWSPQSMHWQWPIGLAILQKPIKLARGSHWFQYITFKL